MTGGSAEAAHISLVTLGVADVDRASAFYRALGWHPSSASVEGTVTFLHGTPVLALFGLAELADDAGLPPPAGVTPGRSALAMNLRNPDEVDRVIARAEAAGARVTQRARRTAWGGYSGYFLDLDAHLWEIAYNPGFPLGSDGVVHLPDAGRAQRTSQPPRRD